jgi:hypothetical protein
MRKSEHGEGTGEAENGSSSRVESRMGATTMLLTRRCIIFRAFLVCRYRKIKMSNIHYQVRTV